MPIEQQEVQPTPIEGLAVIRLKRASDERGIVREVFRASALGHLAGQQWSQINLTWTRRGAIRGLHGEDMAKLVTVAAGSVWGVWVDTRKASPTFGQVHQMALSPGLAVLVPCGVCNGFQATSERGAEYLYAFTQEWSPDMPQIGVNPLDPALGIDWPIAPDPADRSLVSAKDHGLPLLAAL